MNAQELRERFPRASADFIRDNSNSQPEVPFRPAPMPAGKEEPVSNGQFLTKEELQTERELQAQLRDYLRQRGVREVCCPNMTRRSTINAGWPDLTFCYHGVPCAWECKTVAGKLSKEQEAIAPRLEADGWRYAVIRNVQEAKAALDTIDATDSPLPE